MSAGWDDEHGYEPEPEDDEAPSMRRAFDEHAYEAPDAFAEPDNLEIFDPNKPPAPKTCKCGAERPWKWWKGRVVGSITMRPRWCPQAINPCAVCKLRGEREEARRELDRRQEAAGIAPVHREYSWGLRILQDDDEPWVDFAHRVRLTPGAVGVAEEDVLSSQALREWEPGHGSVYLHGPVGSGKSLWVAATLSKLIAPTEGSVVEMGRDQLIDRGMAPQAAARAEELGLNKFVVPGGLQLYQCLQIDEEEVVRRVSLSWKGDPVPLLGIARVQVLAYDDLGTVLLGGSQKMRELARTCIARLLDLRWRERRPMLFTSNRTLDEVCDALDRKSADRLRQIVSAEVPLRGVPPELVAKGISWRNLPRRST